jgi:lycopene beta-cyclase
MKPYDFIIAGGGIAGLSLAYHLIQSPLRDQSILIIDKDRKTRNDRTLSFWSSRPTTFDDIASHSWDRLRVIDENFEAVVDLGTYRYHMIRSIDFYRFVQQTLAACSNVEFVQGTINRMDERDQQAAVLVDEGTSYNGKWVFDSRFTPSTFRPEPARCRYFQQRFQGWEIETETDVFDPLVPIFMDFRTSQVDDLRFCYVLPLSERQALVECVQMGQAQAAHGPLLKTYIENTLGIDRYRILSKEGGVNLLTDWFFPRRAGPHIMNIGTRGGRIKPSSGYAFMRIQHDSVAIVHSLLKSGHPFDIPRDPRFYRLCDTLMLRVMNQRRAWLKPLFVKLFQRNPIERILSFLDETPSPGQNLRLTASLVPELISLAFSHLRSPRPTSQCIDESI